jgi:uncharacterized protein (TIGR03435 family)
MMFRLLMLLALLAGSMFTQPGPLKAGDFAPGIVFTRILNNGSASDWTADSLSGQVTVLVFYPDTSHNLQSVIRWNALVQQFAGKPIQFAWITGEQESSLLPWLQQHPVNGWVFYDPDGSTGRAYRMDLDAAVIIGADRRIVGYDESIIPDPATLNAALDGRLTTVLLQSAEARPSYMVHISPAKSVDGLTLKQHIAQLYDVSPIRIHLPPALDDDQRYDIALVLPAPESTESTNNRILQAIQDYFGVTAAREERWSDVYVVTTANGKSPAPLARPDDGSSFVGASFSSVRIQVPEAVSIPEDFPKPVGIADLRGISLKGTLDDFCRDIERALDRPVINETNLKGEYELDVKAAADGENDFLERLRDQFNLSITPAQRRVEVVVLKPR